MEAENQAVEGSNLKPVVEAIVMASESPVSLERLAKIAALHALAITAYCCLFGLLSLVTKRALVLGVRPAQGRDIERIVRIGDDLAGQNLGAFAHDAGVAAIEQHGAHAAVRAFEEPLDVRAAGEDHGP